MKKILGIIALSLLLSGNAYAESKLLVTKDHGAFTISTFCVDGYKFITTHKVMSDYVRSDRNSVGNAVAFATAISIEQFFENVDGKSLPQKC